MSFETGFTADVIQVLLDRFSENYGMIIYSQETQEVTILKSLQHTILKGGKPVSDLLERELSRIKDGNLILAMYEEMKEFWELSKRKFDQTIKDLFENELLSRGLFDTQSQNDNDNYFKNENDNQNHNENDNEESSATNRGTIRADAEEKAMLEKYSSYLKRIKPLFTGEITSENIVFHYYEQMIGEVHPHIDTQLVEWQWKLPKSLILEALNRSVKANKPILYANTIIENWENAGVKTYKDVINLDKNYK